MDIFFFKNYNMACEWNRLLISDIFFFKNSQLFFILFFCLLCFLNDYTVGILTETLEGKVAYAVPGKSESSSISKELSTMRKRMVWGQSYLMKVFSQCQVGFELSFKIFNLSIIAEIPINLCYNHLTRTERKLLVSICRTVCFTHSERLTESWLLKIN